MAHVLCRFASLFFSSGSLHYSSCIYVAALCVFLVSSGYQQRLSLWFHSFVTATYQQTSSKTSHHSRPQQYFVNVFFFEVLSLLCVCVWDFHYWPLCFSLCFIQFLLNAKSFNPSIVCCTLLKTFFFFISYYFLNILWLKIINKYMYVVCRRNNLFSWQYFCFGRWFAWWLLL